MQKKLLLVVAVVMGLVAPGMLWAKQNTTFSKGSDKSIVLELQGGPDSVTKHHTYEVWHYDYNSVTISLKDGKVMEWCNTNGKLKVPAEKKVEKKTVAKDSRDKRKYDREVKSISLGVVSGSRHKQGNESWRRRLASRSHDKHLGVGGSASCQRQYYDSPINNDHWTDENSSWVNEPNQPTHINCASGFDDQGNHYMSAGGGNAWRSDGTFMQKTGGGFIDTKTGGFVPCN